MKAQVGQPLKRRSGQAAAARDAVASARAAQVEGVAPSAALQWMDAVEQTVTGFGYELVDTERGPQGLLRVFIDRVPGTVYDTDVSVPSEFVTVDDCEKVTRQLQYVLEVHGCDYKRLEVSSPGLDRPLKRDADYARFAGERIDLTLRLPFEGRKRFQGVLRPAPAGWELHFNDGKTDQVLGFTLDEVREARLVPVVNFKGRRSRWEQGASPAGQAGPVSGEQEE